MNTLKKVAIFLGVILVSVWVYFQYQKDSYVIMETIYSLIGWGLLICFFYALGPSDDGKQNRKNKA